ncbi:hypothetical protein C8R46DRAFT_475875 [Mycena filopes]|nr:hypothetical protein C8R46DRAFT_475875 [Mycena filopes]
MRRLLHPLRQTSLDLIQVIVPYPQLRCGRCGLPSPSSCPRVMSALLGHTMRKGLRVEDSVCEGRQSLLNVLFMAASFARVTVDPPDEALHAFQDKLLSFTGVLLADTAPAGPAPTPAPALIRPLTLGTRVLPSRIEARARIPPPLLWSFLGYRRDSYCTIAGPTLLALVSRQSVLRPLAVTKRIICRWILRDPPQHVTALRVARHALVVLSSLPAGTENSPCLKRGLHPNPQRHNVGRPCREDDAQDQLVIQPATENRPTLPRKEAECLPQQWTQPVWRLGAGAPPVGQRPKTGQTTYDQAIPPSAVLRPPPWVSKRLLPSTGRSTDYPGLPLFLSPHPIA